MSTKTFILSLISLFLLIPSSLQATGYHVRNKLLLMPYPQEVAANFNTKQAIEISENITLKVSDNCIENCTEFLQDNFRHSILYSLKKQKKLRDFRLSIFEQIDLPRFTPEIVSTINQLTVTITPENNKPIYPKLFIGVNESYTLTINEKGIEIKAYTVYGARHGFETLIQLVKKDDPTNKFIIIYVPITIKDFPRFRWRGLMIDPSRNLLSPQIIIRIVDALSALKANILHIHMSDAQAFTFESKKFPNLHKKGMYDQTRVLTQDFLKELGKYGRKRGVIVYGEFDIPSHTAVFGLGYPGTVCNHWSSAISSGGYGENYLAMNPANETTFKIIDAIMEELAQCLDNDYIHVGGDEVQTDAWSSAKEADDVRKFMKEHNLKDYRELEGYFNKYAQDAVIRQKKTPVVWQEVFSNGFLRDGAVVHSWAGTGALYEAVKKKQFAIFSSGWYFDVHSPNGGGQYFWAWTNRNMYHFDPARDMKEEDLKYVLGGEGCSWGENCDEQNIFDRVFQRFGAVAERLWSSKNEMDTESHEVRANWVRCLLLRRKIFIGTGPLYHAFCQTEDHLPKEYDHGKFSFIKNDE